MSQVMSTAYFAPEEWSFSPEGELCGSGLRCLSDPYWLLDQEPEPLPGEQLAEIEQALQERITAGMTDVSLWDEPEQPTVKRRDMEAFDVLWRYICGNTHVFEINYHQVMQYTNSHTLPCGCPWNVGITMTEEQPT